MKDKPQCGQLRWRGNNILIWHNLTPMRLSPSWSVSVLFWNWTKIHVSAQNYKLTIWTRPLLIRIIHELELISFIQHFVLNHMDWSKQSLMQFNPIWHPDHESLSIMWFRLFSVKSYSGLDRTNKKLDLKWQDLASDVIQPLLYMQGHIFITLSKACLTVYTWIITV